jgi:CubicO group peptidase (beta-lactamase class C family)
VLALMAEGLGNTAIAERLFVTEGAVHKHIRSIFAKLDLAPDDRADRRVTAVLRYLEVARSTGPGGSRSATAGVADKATGRAARSGDLFRIGSTTKTYVATVVLQLVGEGRLSLDDTVEHWLPGVVSGNGNDGSGITVRQLLQHTSGLFNYTSDFPMLADVDGYQAGRYTTWTPRSWSASRCGTPRTSRPAPSGRTPTPTTSSPG